MNPGLIYETDLRKMGDDLHCKIQERQRLDGTCQQRHIWFRIQGEDLDPPRVGDWISVPGRNFARSIANKTARPDLPDEQGELIEALRRIARGHNDPRGLARCALHSLWIGWAMSDE